jgi:peptidoglycan hydrolase-like protein with peptidoglycan-binding domain
MVATGKGFVMSRDRIAGGPRTLVVVGIALTLTVAACGGGSSSSGRTTVPTTTPAPTTGTTASGATTAPATTFAPGQTATTATPGSGSATTAAGRVVTNPSNSVHQGDTGPGVKQIQTALVGHGYKVGTDGQFGAQTAAAVVDFQKKNGLTPDGVVGPATWAKLQAAPSASSTAKATTTTTKKAASTTAKSTTTVAH